MVDVIAGVVNEFPVPKAEPPVAEAYHEILPILADAPKTTVPVLQRAPGVVEVITGVTFMVAVTGVLVDEQEEVEAST